MKIVLRIAVRVARGWTRLYTLRMPLDQQVLRRDAIDSDIWEYLNDAAEPDAIRAARHIISRAVRGMPDDVRWRIEHRRFSYLPHAVFALTVVSIGAAAIVNSFPSIPPPPRPRPPAILTLEVPPPPPPPPEKQGGQHDRDYWRSRP